MQQLQSHSRLFNKPIFGEIETHTYIHTDTLNTSWSQWIHIYLSAHMHVEMYVHTLGRNNLI